MIATVHFIIVFIKKSKHCCWGNLCLGLSRFWSLPVQGGMCPSKLLRNINCGKPLNVKAPHSTSLFQFLWIAQLCNRCNQIGPFNCETEAEDWVLISLSFSLFTWKQNCKNGNDNTTSERHLELHSLQQSWTSWTLPANQLWEMNTRHCEIETKPKQNKTIQSNCKLM